MLQFSVLMSLYFKETPSNLEQCFASLYAQTLHIPEVVCVFDGAVSYELENVVISWSEKLNIKIVKIENNVGLGNALNIGLKQCTYEIIARMDTDDICHPSRLERQLKFLIHDEKLVLLGSNIAEFESNPSEISGYRIVPSSTHSIYSYCKYKSPFNHMTVVFRKSAILSVGGYLHHPLMEDYNLWLRLIAQNYKVKNMEDILVFARVGHNMIGRRRGMKYISSELKLAKLKVELNIQPRTTAFCVFLLRSIPRLLPSKILSVVYFFIRKKSN